MDDTKKPLGRILVQRKIVSQKVLDETLAAREGAIPLASALAEAGHLDETDALRALSEQYGVPGIDLRQVAIQLEHLDYVPLDVARAHKLIPVLAKEDRIFVAMVNPRDKRTIDELEFVSGRKIFAYVAVATTLATTIEDAYAAKAASEPYFVGPDVPEATLRQLGLAPRSERTSVAPEAPAVVIDDALAASRSSLQIQSNDFESLSPDVSALKPLPTAEDDSVTARGDKGLVLVVDDEEDIRALVRALLTKKGYQVIEADRGLTALAMVKSHMPDLILLDAMLPELHGFDIAKRIKGSERYGQIPIVMMSAVYRGWRIKEDLKQSYGIEEYVEKPFKLGDVVAAVERQIMRRHDSGAPSRDPEAMSRDAERLLGEGVAAYRKGDVEGAIAKLREGIHIDPLAFRLRYHLGLLYGKSGRHYDGIAELERALDLNGSHFPALKNLAVLYEKAGFRKKAVEMWERCVGVAPDEEARESIKAHLLSLL